MRCETDAIIIVDAQTRRVTDANEAAEMLYGYSREEFLELHATDLSAEPAKSADHIQEVVAGAPAAAARGPVHRLHKKRDGTVISVEFCIGASRADEGRKTDARRHPSFVFRPFSVVSSWPTCALHPTSPNSGPTARNSPRCCRCPGNNHHRADSLPASRARAVSLVRV